MAYNLCNYHCTTEMLISNKSEVICAPSSTTKHNSQGHPTSTVIHCCMLNPHQDVGWNMILAHPYNN